MKKQRVNDTLTDSRANESREQGERHTRLEPYRQDAASSEGMSSPPNTPRDCRSFCSPSQTVKKLLEQKRQQHGVGQIPASLVEYNQDTGAISSSQFVHQQQDECHGFPRPVSHYAFSPLDDLYMPRPAVLYSHDGRYETGRASSQSLEPHLTAVSTSHASYLPTFTPDSTGLAQISGPCTAAAADPYMGILGAAVSELMPGDLEDARLRLQNLSPEQLLLRDEDGDTILHLCAVKGLRSLTYAAAERFLHYSQLDAKEHKGKTPLLVAVAANQPAIVYDLLFLGADVNAADCKGQTSLHVAGTYGLSNVLRVFQSLQHEKNFDIEARNYDGLTPLHCAVIAHNDAYKNGTSQNPLNAQDRIRETLTCVQLLLQMGANLTSQEIKSNKTVLHLAVQAGNIALVKYFLEIPQADLPGFINMKAHGNTVLHMAAALPPYHSTKYLIELLLQHGGDPSMRNLENDQPAHLVPPGELSEEIKLLLKKRRPTSSIRSQSATSL